MESACSLEALDVEVELLPSVPHDAEEVMKLLAAVKVGTRWRFKVLILFGSLGPSSGRCTSSRSFKRWASLKALRRITIIVVIVIAIIIVVTFVIIIISSSISVIIIVINVIEASLTP